MRIHKISMQNFMRHDNTEITLPKHGVVLVVGANGSGKSSIAEAVSVALWGKSLRGSQPWRSDQAGSARIEADGGLVVERRKTARGSPKLSWSLDNHTPQEFGSTTKAQEELESRIGSWENWRKTSIFSSQDAAHFTTATDGERKRLLEDFLGCDRFDPALTACRKDLREARQELASLDREHAILRERLAGNSRRLQDLQNMPQLALQPTLKETEVAELVLQQSTINAALRGYRAKREAIFARQRAADTGVAAARVELRARQQEADRLDRDACPTCAQPIPRTLRQSLQDGCSAANATVEEAVTQAQQTAQSIAEEAQQNTQEQEQLAEELDQVNNTLTSVRVARAHNERVLAEQAKQTTALSELVTQIEVLERKLTAQQDEMLDLQAEVAVLEASERALGLEGIRAHMLGRALTGIEAVANSWLSRIAGQGTQLHLLPCSEKKTGGVKDAITIEVDGVGGGNGYRGASGGERRRIDVALLFALEAIASAAHNTTPGTLWLDEVLDTLDASGVEAVCEVLHDIARDRTVVVISHAEQIVSALRPDLCINVLDGQVTTLPS